MRRSLVAAGLGLAVLAHSQHNPSIESVPHVVYVGSLYVSHCISGFDPNWTMNPTWSRSWRREADGPNGEKTWSQSGILDNQQTISGTAGPGWSWIDAYFRNHDYPEPGMWPPLLPTNPPRSLDLPYDYPTFVTDRKSCPGSRGGNEE